MTKQGLTQAELAGVDGIDVSEIQAVVDWPIVALNNAFAWIKVGQGPSPSHHDTESHADPMAAKHFAGAKAVRMIPGFYFFGKPSGNPERQADEFFAMCCAARGSKMTMGWGPGELPPMLDLEVYDGLPPAEVEAWIRRFLTRADSLFLTQVGLYSYTSFLLMLAPAASRWPAFWATRLICDAQYDGMARQRAPFEVPTFQQYDGNEGVVEGVIGPCDRDRFVGDLGKLRALCSPVAPALALDAAIAAETFASFETECEAGELAAAS